MKTTIFYTSLFFVCFSCLFLMPSHAAVIVDTGAHTITGDGTDANDIAMGGDTYTATPDSGGITLSGILSGTGGLTQAGPGALSLTGANTYTGLTTISGGTLTVNNTDCLSATSGIVLSGGTLNTTGNNMTLSAPISVTANSIIKADIDTTFTGAISGSANIEKTGGAVMRVNNMTGYTGQITVSAGYIGVNAATFDGSGADFVVNVNDGIRVDVGGLVTKLGSLSGTGTIRNGANNSVTYQIGGNNHSTTFNGVIAQQGTGVVSLDKVGTGTLTLAGTNTYTGATTISGGTLAINSNDRLATTSGINIQANGTLNITATTTITPALTGNGNILKTGNDSLRLNNLGGFTGKVTVADGYNNNYIIVNNEFDGSNADFEINTANGMRIDVGGLTAKLGSLSGTGTIRNGGDNTATYQIGSNNRNSTFSGVIAQQGTGVISLVKVGTGTLTLSGTNTYTGTTSVLEGTLVNRGAIIGSGGNAGPVNVASGATFINSGTLAADTNNAGLFVFASLATTSTFTDTTSGTTTISTTTTYSNGTIGNVYNTGTVVLEMNADYSYTGTFTGSGGLLRKTGSSAFTFNGGFSHTGDISVENGMLAAGKAHQFDTVANINITGSSSVLSLGGHDHALKNVVITDGALRFGPNQPTTGAPYADYANVTLQTLTGSSGVIIMRTDYGAISNGVTGTGGRPMGDRLTISGSASGDYRVIVSNRDSQTPQKLTAGHKLIIVQSGSDIATATFSGTAESGIGLLIITRGDAQSTIFSDTNAWYLSDSNKLTNTADSLLSTASAAGLEWAYLLDSVRQRMGDLRQESLMMPPQTKQSPLAYTTVTSAGGNFWLHGNTYRLDATNDITGTAFDEDVGGVSLGGDKTYRWEDNQYLLGAYLTLSHISRDFSARGDNTTNTRGVGLYFTYLKDNGWYGDTTFLITGNKNKITAYSVDGFTNTAEYSTVSWGLSVEVGRLLMNKRTGWWLEPSGQIAYARLGGDSYTTSNDIDVQYDPANFTQYRIQLRAGRDLPGSSLKPYVKAGLVAVTTSSGRMRAGDRYFRPDMDGTRVEAGVGMSYTFDEKSQFYLDYEYAKADSYTRPWAFSFGYRRTW